MHIVDDEDECEICFQDGTETYLLNIVFLSKNNLC